MKFAVIYDSETGNTKKIALEIYDTIGYRDKEIVNLSEDDEIPNADVYFVGFPVHQRNCGLVSFFSQENKNVLKVFEKLLTKYNITCIF